ncbi:hypothetical protein [Sphingobacterium alkalisoli]|nr:hypothetical protein [Sphingobacterium alkalisoli]
MFFDDIEDPANAVVTAYGINGIPTKVVSIKKGLSVFRTQVASQMSKNS